MQNNNAKFKIFSIRKKYFSLFAFNFSLKRGVGLLEALIYVAIVSLLTVIVVNTAMAMTVAGEKARLKRNVLGEAGIAVERIVREIRLADSVVVSESVFGAHPGVLKLNSVLSASDDTPVTREFYLEGGALVMKEGAAEPVSLTERVTITSIIFHYIDNSDTSEAITLELTAKDEYKNLNEEHNFNITAVLRRSY